MNKRVTFIVLLVVFGLVLFEVFSRVIISFGYGPDSEAYASMKQNEPRYIAQPFLNYINNPRFINERGVREFNAQGIRSTAPTTTDKKEGTYRIVFLGGSTTFGMVGDAKMTFPYFIEQLMDSLPISKKVECINAGLCGGTSAEILAHYLYKINYFKPDMIVIHSGINDAITYMPLADSQYQPDYHNRRRMFPEIEPLNAFLRFCTKSEILSLVIYFVKFRGYVEGGTLERNLFFNFDKKNEWLAFGNDSMFTTRYNAFFNNYKNILTIAAANKQKVVLVTEVVNTPEIMSMKFVPDAIMKTLKRGFDKNNEFFEVLGTEFNVPVCRLSSEDFLPALFMDGDPIHVNERGEYLKAKLISEKIIETMVN